MRVGGRHARLGLQGVQVLLLMRSQHAERVAARGGGDAEKRCAYAVLQLLQLQLLAELLLQLLLDLQLHVRLGGLGWHRWACLLLLLLLLGWWLQARTL